VEFPFETDWDAEELFGGGGRRTGALRGGVARAVVETPLLDGLDGERACKVAVRLCEGPLDVVVAMGVKRGTGLHSVQLTCKPQKTANNRFGQVNGV
jgi:hypothetical protein